jgi:Endonuclease/Exonuclease/phosphatase family.
MNNSTEGTQTWRITIGNINSFPDESNGNNKIKLDTLRKLVTTNDSDILIICEHNKNLKTIGYHHQPSEIIKKWWPQTITRSSFLASSNSSKFEPGGTMIVTNTRATAHTCQAGEDCQQLGRWNYITLKGKKDRYTTIISVYIPTKYQETYMRQTAYSAKRRKILTNEISPEELWYCDLRALITEKIGEGHEVLVAGDFNDDLNNTQSHTWTFMEELGLRELLLDKYGKGPPTHIRGSTTIDGIFATQRIHMTQGLYIPFESSPSDHRWLIVDILESSITGSARIDRVPPLLRKATSKIPSVQTSFQLLVEQKVVKHQLHSKIKFLYEIAKKGGIFTKELAKQYESIEAPMQKIIKYADKRCRKARRGTVPFSPYQKKLMGEILALKQIKLCFLLKGKPNRPRSQRIRRLVSKYSYTGKTNFTDIHEIQSVIDKAVKKYNEFKPRAQDQQWTYLESIAREYAEKDGKNIQHHFKILQHREQTKEYFRRIRYCEGKLKGGSVDRIQVLQDEETKIIYEKTKSRMK